MNWNEFKWAQKNANELKTTWMSLNKSKWVQMSLNKPKWAWSPSSWSLEESLATLDP